MRLSHVLVTALVLAMPVGAGGGGQAADPKAASVLADARRALGGEEKLAALKALSVRGAYRREPSAPPGGGEGRVVITMGGPGPAGGAAQLTGHLEIDLALPDRYIKVETGTGMLAMTRTEGFEGDRPFSDMSSSQPGVRVMADTSAGDPAARTAALRRSRAELARLLLGLVAGTQASFPVTYAYAGKAESPDGTADVLDVTAPDGFAVRLFIDAASHLPLMLTYRAPERRMVMNTVRVPAGLPAPSADPGAPPHQPRTPTDPSVAEAGGPPATRVEYRMFFAEYRDADGVRLPHHISLGMSGKTIEEWDITGYTVNPALKADRFKVGG